MEDKESTVAKKKLPSIPANYVSLAQLQERWIKEKERKQREKDGQEQLQKLNQKQEESKREFENGRLERRQKRKPKGRRGKGGSHAGAEEPRVAALSIGTAAENQTNNEGLKDKGTRNPWKKKENAKEEDKEQIGDEKHKLPAVGIVGDDRRESQRRSEGASADPTLAIERNFDGLSLNPRNRKNTYGYRSRRYSPNFNGSNNHWNSRDYYGYRRYSSSFNRGKHPRHYEGHGRFWADRSRGDQSPTNMMWVKKGMVDDTDGDIEGTQSSNQEVN